MINSINLVVITVLSVCCLIGFYFYDDAESSTKGPEQPILFSHKIHAGENQIPCEYCHSSASISPRAGIPSVQKCIGCHSQIAGKDEEYKYNGKTINIRQEINKVKEYWNRKEPIPWVRVYYLPEHAHFTHTRHIQRGFECETCHGDVREMDVIKPAQKLEMGWCISCHQENAKNDHELAQLRDCFTCHY